MASLNIYQINITIFFFVTVAVIMVLPVTATLSPSPSNDNQSKACKRSITIDFKNEIFNSTIQAEVKKFSADCCHQLLTSGESFRKLLDEDRRIWDGCFTWFPTIH